MNNTGVIFVRMCNTAGAVGLMLQYYCSTASTANFTAVLYVGHHYDIWFIRNSSCLLTVPKILTLLFSFNIS